jgi:plastocyanin
MRSVFITLIIILGGLVLLFNIFQKFRLDRPVADVHITTGQRLEPRVVTIREGEEVQWINDSDSLQMVTSIPEKSQHAHLLNKSTNSATFHVGRVKPGKSRKMAFYEPGRYLYVAEIWPGNRVATGIIEVKERE